MALIYRGDYSTSRSLVGCNHWLAVYLLFILLLFICLIVVISPRAHAAQTTPYKLNFQGRLVDSSGAPMADGLYNMRFRVWDALTGGTAIWSETRETTNRVQVTNGTFSVQLGDISGMGPTTQYPLYFEIELPTLLTATCSVAACASWTEGAMSPRSPMASAPYATNADVIDGIDGSSLAQLSANQTFTGTNTFSGTFSYQPATDSLTAFQIKNSTGAALLVADTTSNLALKIGGGDVSPDATPALLVLDYKNTAGNPSNGVDGAMYYNSAEGKFRCMEGGAWKDCAGGAQGRYEMHDEMTYGANHSLTGETNLLNGGLALRIGSNGGSFVRQASELNHPGILRFQAGNASVSSNLAAMISTLNTTSINNIVFGSGVWSSNIMLRIPSGNLSDATNTYTTYNGFLDGVTSSTIAPINGCYFKYSHGNNTGKWQGVCRAANNETNSLCDMGVTVAVSTWYNLSVTVNANATLATFALYDGATGNTTICTTPNNIPTASPTSLGLGLTRSAGSAARGIDYDYVEYIGEGLSR